MSMKAKHWKLKFQAHSKTNTFYHETAVLMSTRAAVADFFEHININPWPAPENKFVVGIIEIIPVQALESHPDKAL